MPIFDKPTKDKGHAVRSFLLKLVNNNRPEIAALRDGPRAESRVNLTVVVLVIPIIRGQPDTGKMFAAVTREFNLQGLSLVLNNPRALDKVILAFRWDGGMKFVRAKARHLSPMGAGFYQLGMQLEEMVHPSDCPALEEISF